VALEELRSLGILGGTFNPPHLGHLAIAREAHQELGLDRVLLMPAASIAHKPAGADPGADPGAEHRLRMCRLLVEDAMDPSALTACALEVERGGNTYTVDTLEELHGRHPHAQMTLIVGADTARTLPSWREPARLLALADLAVARRTGVSDQAVLQSVPSPGRVRFLHTPPLEVSSSTVRERLARGEQVDDLVGGAVAGYISEHGLYRARAGALG
jgi:nicotinate-nucleotide adenylyltransferase